MPCLRLSAFTSPHNPVLLTVPDQGLTECGDLAARPPMPESRLGPNIPAMAQRRAIFTSPIPSTTDWCFTLQPIPG